MKILSKLGITGMAIIALSLCSCDSKSKLAENLNGTWATNPQMVASPSALNTSVIDMMQFNLTDATSKPKGGNVMLTSMVNLTLAAPASDEIVQPYSYSASGIASVQGEWKAVDDDEVMVTLDPSTFNVTVDPNDVVMQDNILTGENNSYVDSIKPQLAQQVQTQIAAITQPRIAGVRKIDDIHIDKSGQMKCEINDIDLRFMRQ